MGAICGGLYWDIGKENGNCYLGFRVQGVNLEQGSQCKLCSYARVLLFEKLSR